MSQSFVDISVTLGNKRGEDRRSKVGYNQRVRCRTLTNELSSGCEAEAKFYPPSPDSTEVFGEVTLKTTIPPTTFHMVGGNISVEWEFPLQPMGNKLTRMCFKPSDLGPFDKWIDQDTLSKIMYYITSPDVERSMIGITRPLQKQNGFSHALLWTVVMSRDHVSPPPQIVQESPFVMVRPLPPTNPACTYIISLALQQTSGFTPISTSMELPMFDYEEGQDAKRAHH